MSGPWHPTGRARVSSRNPEAHGVCQRCGFRYLRKDLRNQVQWQGMQLQPLYLFVCSTCYDVPQIQLKAIILPPDPIPVPLALPENYEETVPSYLTFANGNRVTTEDGVNLTTEIRVTPSPDPNNPYYFAEE